MVKEKMPRKKRNVTVCMDMELHRKLSLLSFAYQYGTGNKKMSMSEIIDIALHEYFTTHEHELNEAVEACKGKYEWFNI